MQLMIFPFHYVVWRMSQDITTVYRGQMEGEYNSLKTLNKSIPSQSQIHKISA